MYKLVAIDLDGTLLNSYGEVSEKNKEAIQKAKNKGAEIVIASGRPISSARSYAYEVEADNYIICGNITFYFTIIKIKMFQRIRKPT